MEEIREKVNQITKECEAKGIPCLVAMGLDKVSVAEYAPDNTPEIMKRARAVLFNSTNRARRTMEIEG
jgi:hypothetical protein